VKVLHNSGILEAYECNSTKRYSCDLFLKDVLKSICKAGLPTGNIYEYAAQQVLNYEKKYKRKGAVKIGNKGLICVFKGF